MQQNCTYCPYCSFPVDPVAKTDHPLSPFERASVQRGSMQAIWALVLLVPVLATSRPSGNIECMQEGRGALGCTSAGSSRHAHLCTAAVVVSAAGVPRSRACRKTPFPPALCVWCTTVLDHRGQRSFFTMAKVHFPGRCMGGWYVVCMDAFSPGARVSKRFKFG